MIPNRRPKLAGRKPAIASHSVCHDCKLRGTPCFMVAHGTPCLGPITQAGCGAICPAFGRGCYGCFGPVAEPNVAAACSQLRRLGMTDGELDRIFATFNAAAPELALPRIMDTQRGRLASGRGLRRARGA
ncbi:MAG: hypothetical protein ABSB76_29695 [Streptosporangiaceae bacterium]|jgi:sulfhydrogenase subunit delta